MKQQQMIQTSQVAQPNSSYKKSETKIIAPALAQLQSGAHNSFSNQGLLKLLASYDTQPRTTSESYEREANLVAAQLVRTSGTISNNSAQKTAVNLRTQGIATGGPSVSHNLESKINSSLGLGCPLPEYVKDFFEPRLACELSDVRIHTNSSAAESAQKIHARSYTVGRHIVFGPGEFSPNTIKGKSLLGHELVHVVQQSFLRKDEQHQRPYLDSVNQPKLLPGLALTGASSVLQQCGHCIPHMSYMERGLIALSSGIPPAIRQFLNAVRVMVIIFCAIGIAAAFLSFFIPWISAFIPAVVIETIMGLIDALGLTLATFFLAQAINIYGDAIQDLNQSILMATTRVDLESAGQRFWSRIATVGENLLAAAGTGLPALLRIRGSIRAPRPTALPPADPIAADVSALGQGRIVRFINSNPILNHWIRLEAGRIELHLEDMILSQGGTMAGGGQPVVLNLRLHNEALATAAQVAQRFGRQTYRLIAHDINADEFQRLAVLYRRTHRGTRELPNNQPAGDSPWNVEFDVPSSHIPPSGLSGAERTAHISHESAP
ncbi:MAG: DUF4157 domain-containing protein [Proteobacteria bacterium]|nr:DUF4157 domain-containing protein [Pseudomonadota bacterium]